MTDSEYIEGLKADNQAIITDFYETQREQFKDCVSKLFSVFNDDLLAEIFQESVVRLWLKIKKGQLSASTLTIPLSKYLISVGKYVALEFFRKENIFIDTDLRDNSMIDIVGLSSMFGIEDERYLAIRQAVYNMGEPCAPLLLHFYWDQLSMDDIANKLSYKDSNSAKTQKYKCIQKLKSIFLRS